MDCQQQFKKVMRGGKKMREKSNLDIRKKAKSKGVYLWEIAEKLETSECYFIRKLRHELPQEEKDKIFNIIDEIVKERD